MAQPALLTKLDRAGKSYKTGFNRTAGTYQARPVDGLHFPSDALAMRTPFRDAVLNYIFRTARELSDGLLESAEVSVTSTPDEEDSLILDLTLTVNSSWEVIGKLGYNILVKLAEWSQEWSKEEKDDYAQRIYFGLVPSNL